MSTKAWADAVEQMQGASTPGERKSAWLALLAARMPFDPATRDRVADARTMAASIVMWLEPSADSLRPPVVMSDLESAAYDVVGETQRHDILDDLTDDEADELFGGEWDREDEYTHSLVPDAIALLRQAWAAFGVKP